MEEMVVLNADTLPKWDFDSFTKTSEPYEYVAAHSGNNFQLTLMINRVDEVARKTGFKGFRKAWSDYLAATKPDIIDLPNYTGFSGQPMALECGKWQCTDKGVTRTMGQIEITAVPHPLTIKSRLTNIDTGEEKLELAYKKGDEWRTVVVEKRTIASTSSILDLANIGIMVNSENAKEVVAYLGELEALNYDDIPNVKSVSHLGWVGKQFSPYLEDIVFDGNASFGRMFLAVDQKGDFAEWINVIGNARRKNTAVRIILAASFGSVLVDKLGALPFIVQAWSAESGTGKTVLLMAAASAWGNPEAGELVKNFNGTMVSLEQTAGFCKNIPLFLDEFQLVQNKKDFEKNVYMLAEGMGRTRGKKSGGLSEVPTWRNCTIATGESPITNFVSGSGAINRMVEVECVGALFDDAQAVLKTIRGNYGHAGKAFVDFMSEPEAMVVIRSIYDRYYKQVVESDTTEKQGMAAAVILTADWLLEKWIFMDGTYLAPEDIAAHLHTKKEVDLSERAYAYLCDQIAANYLKFKPDGVENGECWGKLSRDGNEVSIIKTVFDTLCEKGGYSSRSVLSAFARSGRVYDSTDKKGCKVFTRSVRVGAGVARCVVMRLPANPDDESEGEYI